MADNHTKIGMRKAFLLEVLDGECTGLNVAHSSCAEKVADSGESECALEKKRGANPQSIHTTPFSQNTKKDERESIPKHWDAAPT